MKTSTMQTVGIIIMVIVTQTLTSCVQPHQPAYRAHVEERYNPYNEELSVPSAPFEGTQEERRIQAAKKYMEVKGSEDLQPIEPSEEAFKNILAGGKFRRDSDGVITFEVLKTIANGGIIGWSGSDYGFEPVVRETTGVNDRLSVNDVALACVKYKRLPSPSTESGRLVRQRAIQIEEGRGYHMR